MANAEYGAGIGRLSQSPASADLVSAALSRAQFQTTTPRRDLALAGMRDALLEHARRVRSAGRDALGFIYFAGHGVADPSDGENYLFPIDLPSAALDLFRVKALPVAEILALLAREAPDAEHILVVDACRSELQSVEGNPGGRGFAPPISTRIPAGQLLMFSTARGRTARDDTQFASRLSEAIVRVGVPLVVVLEQMALRQDTDARGGQLPWHASQLRREIRLTPGPFASAESDLVFEATDRAGFHFVEANVAAYRRPSRDAGIVEIRARGSVVATSKPHEIFIVRTPERANWVTYQSNWGRAYVPAASVRFH